MNTATYIKEVNNTPVLFNIDNARDMANLEALQAIKMPENMANEIFGNNIRYADNTTCVITENPDNAEFPFNVQFDSSKILAMPQTERKLTDSYLAGIGMPFLSEYINISLPAPVNGYIEKEVVAPANGWFCLRAINSNNGQECQVSISKLLGTMNPSDLDAIITASSFSKNAGMAASVLMPILKGTSIKFFVVNATHRFAKFYYAQGES